MRIELDAAPLSGVEVVFGRDADGDLALKAGTMQGFNYTARDAPVLDLTDKTVTFDEGATTNVVVKITATLTG